MSKLSYEQLMQPRWVEIDGYNGLYMINENAEIKTVSRRVKTGNGGWRITKEKIMKTSYNKLGQLVITLYKDGESRTEIVYRLLAKAFISNPENKPTINHIDGNRRNNKLSNLEWATYSENNYHAYITGLNNSTDNLPDNRKAVAMMDTNGLVLKNFNSAAEAARFINAKHQSISCVCNKKKNYVTAYGYKWKFI